MKGVYVHAYSLSDLGRVRSYNQDTVRICEPSDERIIARDGRLYIVADGAGGVGGVRAGKIASRYAARKVQELYYSSTLPDVGERLRNAMLSANDAIQEHFKRPGRNRRMATTLVAAIIKDSTLIIANVGDSRAYLVHAGTIKQITQDHSLVAGLLADGAITPEEAAEHPQKNVILHSLGTAPYTPRIDIFSLPLEPGDRVLLCTDGLTRYADKETLFRLIDSNPREQAAQRLVDFANHAGGGDNVTVAVLCIEKQPKQRQLKRWAWWLILIIGILITILSSLLGLALALDIIK